MSVKADSRFRASHQGQAQRFCSQRCLDKFLTQPEQYLPEQPDHSQPPTAADPTALYTCPMHPEIRRAGPGTCPKCGMALEPVIPELEEKENPELADFSRRFWWTLPLTLVVTALAMLGHSLSLFHGAAQNWVELALATPVTLWAGWPFFVRGVHSVRQRSPNMWTLIGLGTAAAYLYSLVATLAPQLF
ncbi:MAG TPA: heavy metal-binding domain-containing protein, partial [Pseudomonas sp.]|nr:heavy metal-binding domain-containing protein [Pseudomonas sp.]